MNARDDNPSIQERFFPQSECFGCGPASELGLGLRSFASEQGLEAEWMPLPHHQAFPGVLCGGVIGTLLDCHSNYTAWWALHQSDGVIEPMTVTAQYTVALLQPTPVDLPVQLNARAVSIDRRRVNVEAELESNGVRCATAHGLFIRPRS